MPIEAVEVGERVWSFDATTEKWSSSWHFVERRFEHDYQEDLTILEIGGRTIRATGNHPICVVEGKSLEVRPAVHELPAAEFRCVHGGRWVEARDVEAGDALATAAGAQRVSATSRLQGQQRVYNLGLGGAHTYAVSGAAVLLHNKPWMSFEKWGKDYANQVLKHFKEAGVGTGARSGQHGVPYNRAASALEKIVKWRRAPATDGGYIELAPEVIDVLRSTAVRFRELAKGFNHAVK